MYIHYSPTQSLLLHTAEVDVGYEWFSILEVFALAEDKSFIDLVQRLLKRLRKYQRMERERLRALSGPTGYDKLKGIIRADTGKHSSTHNHALAFASALVIHILPHTYAHIYTRSWCRDATVQTRPLTQRLAHMHAWTHSHNITIPQYHNVTATTTTSDIDIGI